MKGKRTGHTCPLCHIHTFHNHCGTCGYTAGEAEAELQNQIDAAS